MFKPLKSQKIKSGLGESFEHSVEDCYSKAA